MRRKYQIFLWLTLVFFTTEANAQEDVFWDKLRTYSKVNRVVSKHLDINAYTNSRTNEVKESGYGHVYHYQDDMMIKLPEGVSVANGVWAVQIIEARKSVIVTKSITRGNTEWSDFNFIETLLEMKDQGTLTFMETSSEYVLSSTDEEVGQYRRISWCFKKKGKFDISKTIVYFNKIHLTDNTASGGTGEDYSLNDPRLEIVYTDKTVTPIKIEDVIVVDGEQIALTKAYSGYTLIDMTERYEAPKTK